MAWVAVDKNGAEYVYDYKPIRNNHNNCLYWTEDYDKEGEPIGKSVELPKGSIKKLIGRDLTWQNEPIELGNE